MDHGTGLLARRLSFLTVAVALTFPVLRFRCDAKAVPPPGRLLPESHRHTVEPQVRPFHEVKGDG
jgi:hypothetical protein